MLELRKFWQNHRLRAAFIAVAAAFVVSQSMLLVHEAKYGDAPHDHGGQACVIALAAPGGDKFVVATAFSLIVGASIWIAATQPIQHQFAPAPIRAIRPRASPAK